MAMTKAEKAVLAGKDGQIEELSTRLALRFTNAEKIAPDVPPPNVNDSGYLFGILTVGWAYNAYGKSVNYACSSSIGHAVGYVAKTTTQHPKSLYSTRLLALKALRVDLELRFAKELREIDKMILQEQETPTPLPTKDEH